MDKVKIFPKVRGIVYKNIKGFDDKYYEVAEVTLGIWRDEITMLVDKEEDIEFFVSRLNRDVEINISGPGRTFNEACNSCYDGDCEGCKHKNWRTRKEE